MRGDSVLAICRLLCTATLLFGTEVCGRPSSDKTKSKPSARRLLDGDLQHISEEGFLELKVSRKQQPAAKHTGKDATFQLQTSPVAAHTCVPVSLPVCRDLDLYPLAQFPNHLGHRTEEDARAALTPYLPLLRDAGSCRDALAQFLCLLLAPQCSGGDAPLVPCRALCTAAQDRCYDALKRLAVPWPKDWQCHEFPRDGLCVETLGQITPVPEPTLQRHKSPGKPKSFPLHQSETRHPDRPITELQFKPRNYDVHQLGESEFFQGWADVQGQGAANDYCRVIGTKPSSRFLSCSLGGSTGSDHHFVSGRGFDVGHRHTWFMRDMDGDGRDDYCRCVGKGLRSYISCMKSGEFGFYGSRQQPGSEYTFTVKTTGPCFQKSLNPYLGI